MKEPRTQLVLWVPPGQMTVRTEKMRDDVLLALAEIVLAAVGHVDESAKREAADESR